MRDSHSLKLLALGVGLAFVHGTAWALPASARLFQQTYGYKVSCMLCHANGGGSAANGYGKAFLRAGANLAAFKKIEAQDSDGDGLENLKEILAKSNPGDKSSIPGKTGDWLALAASVAIPQKELELIFPGYTKFSAIEGSLNPKQLEFLKVKLGREPRDDDKVPTFYFAEKDGKRQAVGQLVSEHEGDKTLTTGIAVATSGKVLGIEPLGGNVAKELEGKKQGLAAYKEQSATSLPAKPKEQDLGLAHSSVERSLWLIQAVFGGGAK